MISVREHYDGHLGRIYGWMLGDFATAVADAAAELANVGIVARKRGVAVDLGAGPGTHAFALAEMGFSVIALDTCAGLLDELRGNAGDRDIKPVFGDLVSFRRFCTGPVDAIVCMGDTLTHLESPAAVGQLFVDVASALVPGGVFVATFRDYAGSELQGVQRFIPVRSDAERILTCFLDYRQDRVLVHDILQERSDSGWKTTVSAYPKLRLEPRWAQVALTDAGLSSRIECGSRGMVRLVARKSAEESGCGSNVVKSSSDEARHQGEDACMDSDEQAIRELVARWHGATAAGDVDAVLRLMAEDVVFLVAGQSPLHGRVAFERVLRGLLSSHRIQATSAIQEIRVSGDLGYCRSELTVRMVPVAGGDSVVRSGSALSILRRRPHGGWEIFRDANLLSTPAPGATV